MLKPGVHDYFVKREQRHIRYSALTTGWYPGLLQHAVNDRQAATGLEAARRIG